MLTAVLGVVAAILPAIPLFAVPYRIFTVAGVDMALFMGGAVAAALAAVMIESQSYWYLVVPQAGIVSLITNWGVREKWRHGGSNHKPDSDDHLPNSAAK